MQNRVLSDQQPCFEELFEYIQSRLLRQIYYKQTSSFVHPKAEK